MIGLHQSRPVPSDIHLTICASSRRKSRMCMRMSCNVVVDAVKGENANVINFNFFDTVRLYP